MIPLTVNPTVEILLDDKNNIVGIATNIAPIEEMTVNVTTSQRLFDGAALGKSFVTGATPKQ
jgi:hypothetical protein